MTLLDYFGFKLLLLERLSKALVQLFFVYSDWVCTAVMSNDVMKDLRG